ncbi:MAG: hypothetical protein L0220_21840 [Acidobacteria bacterium]|nr:hypothetical protein [Acidobacteriota bacterium]
MRPNLYALDLSSKQITQLTNLDSISPSAQHIRVSPDESQIAFTGSVNGKFHILVMPLQGGQPKQLTNGEGNDSYPAWFPDGKRIAYCSDRAGAQQINLARLDGRIPEEITLGDIDHEFLDVSPDGNKIISIAQKENANIFSVALQTHEEAIETSKFGLQLWPDISPDGTIAFQSSNARVSQNPSIFIKSNENRLTHISSESCDVKWSPDGRTLAFLRHSTDGHEIWTVSAGGGNERRLTGSIMISGITGVPYNRLNIDYSWSPDSAKIAYCSAKSGQQNLWISSVKGSGEIMKSGNTDTNLKIGSPLWAPDGNHIAYVTEPKPRSISGKSVRSVCVIELEGNKTVTVFQQDMPLRLIGWSKSGKEIYVALGEGKSPTFPQEVKFLKVSVDQPKPELLARVRGVYLHNIAVSRDKQTITYVSREDGKDNVHIVPTSGGTPKKITSNNDSMIYFSGLTWAPDGKKLFFSKQTSWALISLIENFNQEEYQATKRSSP